MSTTSALLGGSTSSPLLSRQSSELLRLLQRQRSASQNLLTSRPSPTTQQPLEASDLYKTFSGVRSALGALSPLQLPGLGILSGAAGIGSAISNPYMNDLQKALAAAQSGTQIAGSTGQITGGALGNAVGTYLPYVGTALSLGGILAGGAPDNVKYGQATQALGTLAAQQIASGIVGGVGAGTSGAAAAGGTALGAGLSSAALGGLLGVYAYALGDLVTDLTKSDYGSKRSSEATSFDRWITPFMENIQGATSEQELRDVLAKAQGGEFGNITPAGNRPGFNQFRWSQESPTSPGGISGEKYLGEHQGFYEADINEKINAAIANQRALILAASRGDPRAIQSLNTARQRLGEYKNSEILFSPALSMGLKPGNWTPEYGFEGFRDMATGPYGEAVRGGILDRIALAHQHPENQEPLLRLAERYGFDFSTPYDPLHMASASA